MAPVVTSYTPTTGTTAGGTQCTITGTGLDTVTVVLVGTAEATIVGTPTATTLVFRTPTSSSATSQKVTVIDTAAGTSAQAGTSFVYTLAPVDELLVTTLAKKFRVDVNTGTSGSPVWTKVRGITTLKPGLNTNTEDDSDYDSGDWSSTVKTQLGWLLDFTVKRGLGAISGAYDPGQQALWTAHDQTGAGGTAQVRWYDRKGGPEAYTGYAQVQWSPQGGDTKTTDKVDVSLEGQGARTKITNPVIADPSLAA